MIIRSGMDRTNVPIIHAAVHVDIAKKLHPSDVFTFGPIPENSVMEHYTDTDTQPTSACEKSYRAPIPLPCFAICNGFSLGMDQESSSSCHSFALPKVRLVIWRSSVNTGKIWLQLTTDSFGPLSSFSALGLAAWVFFL